uniref:Protein KRI1 homolog n=1 Tax=Nicotiana tabacum TaxID=4097 RepID=A0A1S4DBF9_TOBAC|nr:PREDICTED: protein KRI1 homolog [Nicotiana tabacum]
MGMKLFDGDDDDVEKLDKIEINEEFARRYEHNKKREDLQKLEELKKKGVIDDESSSEDTDEEEEEEDLNPTSNLKFFDGLLKIKKGDPVVLNNKDAKLFDSESESESETNFESEEKKHKNKKPMYLKDVVSKHLIEEGPEFGDEEEEKKVKTYSEEQEDLREEFLNAVKEDEEEEDLFKVKENEKREDGLGDDEEEEGDNEFAKKLDEFFGEDEKLDEETVFLKDFFRKKMWKDDKKGKRGDDGEDVEFSEDEEEIERQEDYEREFNFRFEENAGDRVWGHSRQVEGSVRKKTNTRKLQRERKEERMVQAEEERKEELKRLKNLKKKEMKERLDKIKETAGIGEDEVCLLDVDDLEEEFDPDEHDRKMKVAFSDAYYEADDIDPEFGSDKDEDDGDLEKPDFDKEDELLGLPKGWDKVDEPRDGFLSTREKLLKAMENEGGDHEQTGDDNKGSAADDEVAEEGKRKKKRKRTSTLMKTVKEQLMEEYYKLDYEDTIGDLKTRFKYRPVRAKRFGLTPEEMLTMEDKELSQYVSLKKIAPYREKEWKVDRLKTLEVRKKLKGEVSHVPKTEKKRKFGKKENFDGETDDRKGKQVESNGDTSKQSRRSRRRKQQAEHKLSEVRLKAYSANPSESNSKKK